MLSWVGSNVCFAKPSKLGALGWSVLGCVCEVGWGTGRHHRVDVLCSAGSGRAHEQTPYCECVTVYFTAAVVACVHKLTFSSNSVSVPGFNSDSTQASDPNFRFSSVSNSESGFMCSDSVSGHGSGANSDSV